MEDSVYEFILKHSELVETWVEGEQKRLEDIVIPHTEQDYALMFQKIQDAINGK